MDYRALAYDRKADPVARFLAAENLLLSCDLREREDDKGRATGVALNYRDAREQMRRLGYK